MPIKHDEIKQKTEYAPLTPSCVPSNSVLSAASPKPYCTFLVVVDRTEHVLPAGWQCIVLARDDVSLILQTNLRDG